MSKASGKFVLRIPPALHERLRSEAYASGNSLNDVCRTRLSAEGHQDKSWHSQLRESLEREFGAENVLALMLFGSRVRGDATESSDLDLLIVLGPQVEITRDLYLKWDQIAHKQSELNRRKVSPHFVALPSSTKEAGSLWFEVALYGRILFSRGEALEKFLFDLRRLMAESKLKRHMLHGHPYWERFDEE